MNHDPVEIRLRELAWRRELTDAERAELQAWLVAHPDAQAEWETEEQLSLFLNRLPDAPVSLNFTARVMQAVGREAAPRSRETRSRWNLLLRSLLPRVAVAVVVVSAGLFGYHRYQLAQSAQDFESLVAFSEVMSLTNATFLEDFDAIRRMGRTPPVDEELLALMQ